MPSEWSGANRQEESLDEIEIYVQGKETRQFRTIYDVVELPNRTATEFHVFSNHNTVAQLTPAKEYRVQNLRRITTDNKQYLGSTNSTRIQETSNSESIDEITIAVTAQIRDQSHEKRYQVLTPTRDDLVLSLLMRYDPDRRHLEGIYKLQNIVAIDTIGAPYLQNTQDTVIAEATDVQYDLDLLIMGDTHIGYRNLPENIRDHGKNSCRRAFKKLIQGSIAEDIDGILHTGDIFESSEPTDADYEWVKNQLETLQQADIGFVYIRGDHDPSQQGELFPELDHVMHLGTDEEQQVAGFSFIGYDHDQVSHPRDIPVGDYNKKLIFIHPADLNCKPVYGLDVPDTECTQAAIFAGDCHTTGKRIYQETPLVFTGSPAGMNRLREGSSFYRAKIWREQVVLLDRLSL
jgi:hypothetical protein